MGRSKSIQFYDSESILEVFEQRGIPNFAIWHDNEMMFPHETDDMDESLAVLAKYLEHLSTSPVVYALKIYRKVPEEGITNKTPHNGSSNFRLMEPDNQVWKNPGLIGLAPNGSNSEILAELKAMRLKMEQMEAEREETSESKLGWVGELLENEHVMGLLNHVLPALLSGINNNNNMQQNNNQNTLVNPNVPNAQFPVSGGIAGIPSKTEFDQAIEQLERKDQNFREYIVKLAHLSIHSPKKFDSFIAMVKMMM